MSSEVQILRMAEVKKRIGLSRSTIYRLVAANQFPRPIRLGLRSTGWLMREIGIWEDSRIQERDGAMGC